MALPLGYHWRSLFVRSTTTLLTVLVIAAVIGTLVWILGFAIAVRSSLAMAHDPRKVLVLAHGATSETNSGIGTDELRGLTQLTGIELDVAGEPLISPELYWQIQLPRIRDGGRTCANVALRGVTDKAFQVHRNIVVLDRKFSTGDPEVIVGLNVAKQFGGVQIGDKIKLGFGENREFKVVGYFSAGGGPMETEIWMYLPAMQSAYQRNGYSSAALRLMESASPSATVETVKGPAINLNAMTEADYWDNQSQSAKGYQIMCFALVAIMGLAAIFAIANTMYAAVAGRSREIAMLRTIGFRGWHILVGFVTESVMLSLLGGLLGIGLAALYLGARGNTKDMFGSSSFTTMAFEIHLTFAVVGIAMGTVLVIGVLGALFPAWRAARTPVIAALRERNRA